MTENDFLLNDRIAKIHSVEKLHGLQENAVIAFSGGKDSCVLSALIDEALPQNKIPRVFVNTGIEHKMILDFVRELKLKDNRIVVLQGEPMKKTLESKGYPFKSKEYSHKLRLWKQGSTSESVHNYFFPKTKTRFCAPKKLLYQLEDDFKLPISEKCCFYTKERKHFDFMRSNHKTITISGIRKAEGGQRTKAHCISHNGKIMRFNPIVPLDNQWVSWYVERNKIAICPIYLPPYNFVRTGCVGCPFSPTLEKELQVLQAFFPKEYALAESLWKPIYDEYRKKNFRLKAQKGLTFF